jgi:MerR family redox-sensitive transcriptional activator SoxR
LRDKLTSCIGCGCLSLNECGLLNPGDLIASEGPGARYLDVPANE